MVRKYLVRQRPSRDEFGRFPWKIAMAVDGLLSMLLACISTAIGAGDEPGHEKPIVLTPVEFRTAYARLSVRSYMLSQDGTKIAVIRAEGTRKRKAMIDLDELAKHADVRLAEQVLPLRMVI